jgi:hypothetical protein
MDLFSISSFTSSILEWGCQPNARGTHSCSLHHIWFNTNFVHHIIKLRFYSWYLNKTFVTIATEEFIQYGEWTWIFEGHCGKMLSAYNPESSCLFINQQGDIYRCVLCRISNLLDAISILSCKGVNIKHALNKHAVDYILCWNTVNLLKRDNTCQCIKCDWGTMQWDARE